jgi:DNA-binding GntR family transcriptional regulator
VVSVGRQTVISTLGPRARRVYTVLRDGLRSGEVAPGAKLPSHTELADQFGVTTLTVCRVLAHLEQEGLVTHEHGRGTFARTGTTAIVPSKQPAYRTAEALPM